MLISLINTIEHKECISHFSNNCFSGINILGGSLRSLVASARCFNKKQPLFLLS